jgi:hypothetical protein
VPHSRRPAVAFDHVQLAVGDLEAAAERLRVEHGLIAVPGGRHPGRGTANMIVPLGDAYLELIAIADPAEAGAWPASRRVARAVASGRTFAVWVARTGDLDAARSDLLRLGFALPEVVEGRRQRPDGLELRWRMQELVAGGAFSPLPFLIEWRLPPGQYPGAAPAAHARHVHGVAEVRLSDPEPAAAHGRLRAVLGDDLPYRVSPGPPGVEAVVLDTGDGPLVLS